MLLREISGSSHDLDQRNPAPDKATVKTAFPTAYAHKTDAGWGIFTGEDEHRPIGTGATPEAAWSNAVKAIPKGKQQQKPADSDEQYFYVTKGLPVEGSIPIPSGGKVRLIRIDNGYAYIEQASSKRLFKALERDFQSRTVLGKRAYSVWQERQAEKKRKLYAAMKDREKEIRDKGLDK